MGKLRDRKGNQVAFTMIPNQAIRSSKLDCYDFRVLCAIMSCDPSFPSYRVLAKWCDISVDRVWKSIRKLDELNVIKRFKDGKKVRYLVHWVDPPGGTVLGKPLRFTERTAPPHGTSSLRQAEPIKNKDKELLKRGEESFRPRSLEDLLGEIQQRTGE